MESQESTTSPVPRLEARDQGEYSLRFSGITRRVYRTAAKAQAVKTVRLQAWRFKRLVVLLQRLCSFARARQQNHGSCSFARRRGGRKHFIRPITSIFARTLQAQNIAVQRGIVHEESGRELRACKRPDVVYGKYHVALDLMVVSGNDFDFLERLSKILTKRENLPVPSKEPTRMSGGGGWRRMTSSTLGSLFVFAGVDVDHVGVANHESVAVAEAELGVFECDVLEGGGPPQKQGGRTYSKGCIHRNRRKTAGTLEVEKRKEVIHEGRPIKDTVSNVGVSS